MILKPRLFRKPNLGHRLARGLVGLWLFNEGSGNKVFDLSGSGKDGTFGAGTASPVWVPGKLGSTLSFDDEDYVDLNSNPENGLAKFTFSAWVYGRRFDNNPYIYGNAATDSTTDGIFYVFIRATPAGTIDFSCSDGSAVIDSTNDGSTLSTNTWHHIAVVSNGSNITRYLDGIQTGTIDAHSLGVVKSWNDSYIGNINYEADAGPQTDRFLNGLIDSILLYNRALSASEIVLLYLNPFIMFEQDPIELWVGATSVGAPVGAVGIMTTNTGFWGPTF